MSSVRGMETNAKKTSAGSGAHSQSVSQAESTSVSALACTGALSNGTVYSLKTVCV